LAEELGKRVLVCPLDWGLGHATRDVQIIEGLLNAGFEVIIGADNAPLSFLQQHFPALQHIRLPSFQISYPAGGSMILKMLFSIPKIMVGIFKEHQQLKKIIKDLQVEIVISDNRFGLWNSKIYSIFITHQLWIKTPPGIIIFERILNRINHWFINKYDECWIPDYAGNYNLSGELSHIDKLPNHLKFIGILSRFRLLRKSRPLDQVLSGKYDILVIISGPEPQRSIFENLLIKQISASEYKAIFVLGKPSENIDYNTHNIKFINHLATVDLETLIVETPVIISRSGYSTIMDLVRLNKSAILVPTPGQTEQEYLAKIMMDKKWFYSVSQSKFNLETAIQQLSGYKPQQIADVPDLLRYQINRSLSI